MKTFFTRQGLLGHAVGQVARLWELAVLRSGGTGGQRHPWAPLASSKSAPRCYAPNHTLRVRAYFPKSPRKRNFGFKRMHRLPQAPRSGGCTRSCSTSSCSHLQTRWLPAAPGAGGLEGKNPDNAGPAHGLEATAANLCLGGLLP